MICFFRYAVVCSLFQNDQDVHRKILYQKSFMDPESDTENFLRDVVARDARQVDGRCRKRPPVIMLQHQLQYDD